MGGGGGTHLPLCADGETLWMNEGEGGNHAADLICKSLGFAGGVLEAYRQDAAMTGSHALLQCGEEHTELSQCSCVENSGSCSSQSAVICKSVCCVSLCVCVFMCQEFVCC